MDTLVYLFRALLRRQWFLVVSLRNSLRTVPRPAGALNAQERGGGGGGRKQKREFAPPACIRSSRFSSTQTAPRLGCTRDFSPNVTRRRKRQQEHNALRRCLRKSECARGSSRYLGARQESRHDVGREFFVRIYWRCMRAGIPQTIPRERQDYYVIVWCSVFV